MGDQMSKFLSITVEGLGSSDFPIIMDSDDLLCDFVPVVMVGFTLSNRVSATNPMFVARSEIRFGSEYVVPAHPDNLKDTEVLRQALNTARENIGQEQR